MSKTTCSINRIKEKLDSISGLSGIVGELVETVLEPHVNAIIAYVEKQHENACALDWYGEKKEAP